MSEETIGEVPEVSEAPKRPRKTLIAILLIVIVGVASVSVFTWWYFQNMEEVSPTPSPEYNTYSKYGFSFEYPEDMIITEKGVIDAIANDNSGMITGESFGPYRAFQVSWVKSSTPLTRGELETAVEGWFDLSGAKREGSIVETTKSGHEMIYQRYTYTEDWITSYGIIGMWYCNFDKKVYGLGNEQTTEQDILQIFERYLDSFICH